MINLNLFNVIIGLFLLFAWSRVFLLYKGNAVSFRALFFWTIVWGSIGTVIYLPGKGDAIALFLGVERASEALFSLAIIFIFYMIYRSYAIQLRQTRRINQLVKQISLQGKK